MERAINELQVKLEVYETNGSIWQAAGNAEQAQLCAESAASIKQAIAVLETA